MTKQEVLAALQDCDHAFIKPEAVEEFTKPFGFKGTTLYRRSDPIGTFKGLTLTNDDGERIDGARGQDAAVTAEEIAEHLQIDVPAMYGRGSRLQLACNLIEAHLLKNN